MTGPNRFAAGAIDLGEVKARAEARAQAQQSAATPGGVEPVVTVTMTTAEEAIVERSFQVPVIVLVGSARSQDSEQMREELSALARQADLAWVLAYVDADANPELARMLGIQGLPTVIAMAGGQPLTSFEGGQPAEALQQFSVAIVQACAGKLTGLLAAPEDDEPQTPQMDSRFQPVVEAIKAGDFDTADELLDRIHNEHPAEKLVDRYRAQSGLGRRVAAGGDADERLSSADQLIVAGRSAEGLTLLTDALVGADPVRKKTIQARLLELFHLFEPGDPAVVAARSAMASALF